MRKCLVLFAVCIYSFVSHAQNVGIGVPNPQNKLHVGGGFRLDTLTGVGGAGLVRHDANGVVYGIKFSGSTSDVLRGDGTFGAFNVNGSIGWLLNGNAGTNAATHFLGTTDDQPLLFRVNNIRHGYLGRNIFFGSNAGLSNNENGIIGIGSAALQKNTSGIGALAIGDSALYNNTLGIWNVGLGTKALYANTTGGGNTATGYHALSSNVNGVSNSAYGTFALESSVGAANSAFGYLAMTLNQTGNSNTAFGYSTLYNNISGYENTAVGHSSLGSNNSYYNTGVGGKSLMFNTSGHDNTAVGYSALLQNETASFNTSVGAFSMYNNNLGQENTAVGYKALEQNRTGSLNTAMGFAALQGNTGQANTAFGHRALVNNQGTIGNTAVGQGALRSNTIGQANTAIGYLAGAELPNNVINVTCIGYGTGWNTTLSDHINVGNFQVKWIGGQTGWFHYSDKRIKNDIKDDVPGLSFITRLKPISYHVDVRKQEEIANGRKQTNHELIKPSLNENVSQQPGKPVQKDWEGKYDIEKTKMTGFFAQDVEDAAKAINYSFNGVYNPKNGGLLSLDYSAFVVPLVKAVQEQQKIIEDQNKKIEKQQQLIDLLIKEMQSFKKDLITQKK